MNQALRDELERRKKEAEDEWYMICEALGREPYSLTKEKYIKSYLSSLPPILWSSIGTEGDHYVGVLGI